MSKDTIEVKFSCQKCGSTDLVLPDNYTENSILKCNSCGTDLGRWGDIKAEAEAKALAAAEKALADTVRKAFKGVKGFTIK